MAKYGDQTSYTFTDPKGKKTEFKFQHVGFEKADEILDDIRNKENGGVSIRELRKQLFDHVIFTAEGGKVDYAYFEDQDFGNKMLAAVTTEAQSYIFPKA